MSDSDGDASEAYSFDYSSDDMDADQDDAQVALENRYFEAKEAKETDERRAVELFAAMAGAEDHGVDGAAAFAFRAVKQMCKILYRLGERDRMVTSFERLLRLGLVEKAVSEHKSEKGITSVLDMVSASASADDGDGGRHRFLARVYAVSLQHLEGAEGNKRLWYKVTLKRGYLLHAVGDDAALQGVLRALLRSCDAPAGAPTGDGATAMAAAAVEAGSVDALRRGTQRLEVYALQLSIYAKRRDHRRLRPLYLRAKQIDGASPHPRTVAVIHEAGGRMYMAERDWKAACAAFFQAFKCFDEAGEPRRLTCLKYLVFASRLGETDIDPLTSQEAVPYRNHKEISACVDLVKAFQDNRIADFERTLRRDAKGVLDDDFLGSTVAELLRTLRSKVLLALVVPYTRIRLAYLARELNGIPEADVEALLVDLIMDKRVDGRIDGLQKILYLSTSKSHAERRDDALGKMADTIGALSRGLAARVR